MKSAQVALGAVAGVVAFVVSVVAQLAVAHRLQLAIALVTGLGVTAVVSVVEALQYGRAGPGWLRPLRRVQSPGEAMRLARVPGPPPTLRELQRVLPIGQTQAHDGTAVTLFSLEAYAEGFLVNGRIVRETTATPGPKPIPLPEPAFNATDSTGRRYDAWRTGGRGDGHEWRFAYLFAPALDPSTTELRLVVTEMRWRRFGEGEPPPVEVEPGAWTFTVTL
jgi:hypothetical protein